MGGHLGLTKEQLRDFVQYTDQAMQTIGMSAEDVANSFSKIQRTFSDVSGQDIATTIQQAGSAMNALDKVTTSTEANIMAFTEAVGKMSDGIKPSLADTLALGAAFESAGLDAQQAATGYARILTTARADIGKFTSVMGKTEEELRNLINTKPAEFLLEFAESLKGLPTAEQGEKLKELGLNSQRLDSTIGALTKNTQEFRTALSLSAEEYSKATAMTENYNALNSTATAQLEKAKKRMQDMKAELGNKLIPTITKLADVGAGGLKLLSSIITWAGQHKVLVSAMIALTLKYYATKHKEFLLEVKRQALEKAGIILSRAKNAILATSTTFTQLFALAQAKLTKNTLAAANAQKALKAAFAATPWGAIITAIIALVGVFERLAKATFTAEGRAAALYQKYRDEAEITYKKEESRINALIGIIESETTSRDKKLEAIKKLQEVMPDYKADLDEEGRLLSHNKEKIDEYLTSFRKMATLKGAQAAYEKAEEEYQTKQSEWDAQREIYQNSNGIKKALRAGKRWLLDLGGEYIGRQLSGLDMGPGMADVQAHDAKEVRDRLLKQYEDLVKQYEEEAQKLVLEDGGGEDDDEEEERKRKEEERKGRAAELKKRKQEFREKLADYYQSIRDANIDEFSKLRKDILKKDAELYQEMESLGMVDELQPILNDARNEAFKKMTHDLVAKYQKASLDVMDAIRKTVGKDYSNKIEEELDKESKKWDDATIEVQNNINSLADIKNHLKEIVHTPEELDEVNEAIKVQEALLKEIQKRKIESKADIIKKNYEEILKFAQEKDIEQRRAAELAGKTEKEQAELRKQWRIQEIQEEYDIRIRLAEAELEAKEALNDGDEEGLRKIRDLITELKRLKKEVPNMIDNEGKSKQTPKDEGLLSLFNISSMDPWEENLKRAVNALEELRATAMDVFNSMVEMQQNAAEQELNRFTEAQDAKSRKLQQQLDEGLISQKYYDAQMEKMEAEREKKEKQIRHDEWDREHQASLVNAIAAGALAASNSLANGGGVPWGLIPMGISLITTGANIALIASQVNPYAKGGYIRKKQLALVGEKGPEWVASNTLLEDNETAPVIAALEDYQRGNRTSLHLVAPTQPAWKNLSQSASQISSTFASNRTPVVHHHYQTVGGDELLKEVKQMNQFLADPKNRQAYISYKIQTEAQKNRDFIKQAAKL